MIRIAPSLLAADFGSLAEQVGEIAGEADLLHLDVMDGHFVPNLTIGPPVVASLRKHTGMFFDCHLMVEEPLEFLDPFFQAGANSCSVHVEVPSVKEAIAETKKLGMEVGLALNPDTPFEKAVPYMDSINMILIMTVFPGFGGQSFMAEVLPKIRQARDFITNNSLNVFVEVDGGIDHNTAPQSALFGADTFVAGTSIFKKDRPWEAARVLKNSIQQALGETNGNEKFSSDPTTRES